MKRPLRLHQKTLGPLRDSKKLAPPKREAWFRYLTTHPRLTYAIARVTPPVIDRINITKAANRGALRLVKKLTEGRTSIFTYLDGGITLPDHFPHRTVIKGDEKIKLIAAASIIAKVNRDRYMRRLHRKDPRYRFDIHKGYGTKLHKKFLKQFGHSDFHRKSFAF